MVITNEVELPDCETLTVDEVNLSSATLMTAAPYLGKCCENVNNEFMLCRQELNDPRACVDIGKEVTVCAMGVLKDIKRECLHEFNQYANCVDKSSGNYQYSYCRKTQEVFDCCMKEKLCMQRPSFGYFCRARVHSTTREAPVPPPCPCNTVVSDATPSLPDSAKRTPPRFGGRFYWMTE